MIDWLYDLRRQGVKLGLDSIRALVDVLEHPERSYRVAHVGGTNGKGSVSAMLDAMLAAAGLRSGLFTSPHLIRPNERIRVAGLDLDDVEFDRLLRVLRERIEAAVADGRLEGPPSFFETMTGAALLAFRDHGVDVAVLEVGLGGRLDATNVVLPDVTAIVSVGLDHTKTLGPSLAHIAREKAGIVKPGVPLISGATGAPAVEEIRAACREREAPFVDARRAVRVAARAGDTVTLNTDRASYPDIRLALAGEHQIDNAQVAVATFEVLMERMGRPLEPEAVVTGLGAARWPGRLEWVEHDDARLLLDAAHNPDGLATLARFLDGLESRPAAIVFGATSGKPLDRLLGPLGRRCDICVLTTPPVERSLSIDDLLPVARRHFARVESRPEPAAALALASAIARESAGWVLVTGSLYLVGSVAALIDGRPTPGPVAL